MESKPIESDIKLLEFEQQIVSDLNKYSNLLLVLGKGFSVTKSAASFLYQYRQAKEAQTSPYLIFLVNFSDQEVAATEFYISKFGKNHNLAITKITSSETLSNKRIDLYLKGGVFALTYKVLILDLLTKKLSPSIITGFIINNAQKVAPKTPESFLTQILRRDNPEAFIKCLTDKSNSVGLGGMIKVEKIMKSL
jgi:DNA excision repair protein ERCC-4